MITWNEIARWARHYLVTKLDMYFMRDDRFRLVDNSDTTKRALFNLSGITTATERTLSFPDASGTIALMGGTIDHGDDVTGLADDDHTQYALLAGRTGTNAFTGSISTTGPVDAAADTDAASTFGRAAVGYADVADRATFAHVDQNTNNSAALVQLANGATVLNSASGLSLTLAIGAVAQQLISASNVVFTNYITAAADTNTASTFGRAAIGYNGTHSDHASFSHIDQNSGTNYALLATAGATGTFLNVGTGGTIYHRINNSDVMRMTATGLGIGTAPTAKLHVDQSSATGAIPVLTLDQADVSEEMIQFETTIGTGNAIEAVAAKTLTTTHFIKVTLPGGLTRYIPAGTIA